MALKVTEGEFGSFDKKLSQKVEQFFEGENLLQSILHAHLLLEQALLHNIEKKFENPSVLKSGNFSGLSFAQKITVYVGLYNPDEQTQKYLLAINKVRNMVAHSVIEPEEPIFKYLRPMLVENMAKSKSQTSAPEDAKGVLALIFMLLIFDLGAISGLQRDDYDEK